MTIHEIAHGAVWLLNGIYFIAILPQIFLNYKLKSTRGLNDTMLFMYLVGYIADTIYAYALDLPFGYKVFVPAGLIATAYMLVQRVTYTTGAIPIAFKLWSGLIAMGGAIALFATTQYPILMGHVGGWVSTLLFGTYQIPQIIQVYKRKSVHGLSLFFILTLGLGTSLELFASLVLNLPLPSLITGIRGVTIYSLFLLFFYWYKSPKGN